MLVSISSCPNIASLVENFLNFLPLAPVTGNTSTSIKYLLYGCCQGDKFDTLRHILGKLKFSFKFHLAKFLLFKS